MHNVDLGPGEAQKVRPRPSGDPFVIASPYFCQRKVLSGGASGDTEKGKKKRNFAVGATEK